MCQLTKDATETILTKNLKECRQQAPKEITLKEIRSRGFQSKKNIKYGMKACENIRFDDFIMQLDGMLCTKEEFERYYDEKDKDIMLIEEECDIYENGENMGDGVNFECNGGRLEIDELNDDAAQKKRILENNNLVMDSKKNEILCEDIEKIVIENIETMQNGNEENKHFIDKEANCISNISKGKSNKNKTKKYKKTNLNKNDLKKNSDEKHIENEINLEKQKTTNNNIEININDKIPKQLPENFNNFHDLENKEILDEKSEYLKNTKHFYINSKDEIKFYYFLDDLNLVFISKNRMFRKGCRPNAIIKCRLINNEIFLGVYAIKNIGIKDEIILPFDLNHMSREKCVCFNLDFCLDPFLKPRK